MNRIMLMVLLTFFIMIAGCAEEQRKLDFSDAFNDLYRLVELYRDHHHGIPPADGEEFAVFVAGRSSSQPLSSSWQKTRSWHGLL